MFKVVRLKVKYPRNARGAYGVSRIGNRDIVGFGTNSMYAYNDDAHFPFPSIRFRENDREIEKLRKKECGDWKYLKCDEKKMLYRASFCQTFSEFQHPTGEWKFVLGCLFITTTAGFWGMMFARYFINEPLPDSLSDENQAHQLRRMLEIHTNPIDGISSAWDYEKDDWK